MIHLLEGQRSSVGFQTAAGMLQLTCFGVALTLYDAQCQMVVAENKVGMAPRAVHAEQHARSLFLKLRTRHISVVTVLVGMGQLLAPPCIPHEPLAVAGKVHRIVEESVVSLIAGT